MTTYNTGNALGSTDPRDLYDNSQVFDELVNNTTDPTVQDRFGNTRITLANQLGYNFKGDYAAGIELISYTDIIRYNSEFYRPSASATLPYTTAATLPDVDSNLVPVGDANLRQELALPSATSGSDLISHTGTPDTVTQALDKRTVFVGSVAELEALSLAAGKIVYLSDGSRSGAGRIMTGAAPSDSQKGVYIEIANGNYWERDEKYSLDVGHFGATYSGDESAIAAAMLSVVGYFRVPYGKVFECKNIEVNSNQSVFIDGEIKLPSAAVDFDRILYGDSKTGISLHINTINGNSSGQSGNVGTHLIYFTNSEVYGRVKLAKDHYYPVGYWSGSSPDGIRNSGSGAIFLAYCHDSDFIVDRLENWGHEGVYILYSDRVTAALGHGQGSVNGDEYSALQISGDYCKLLYASSDLAGASGIGFDVRFGAAGRIVSTNSRTNHGVNFGHAGVPADGSTVESITVNGANGNGVNFGAGTTGMAVGSISVRNAAGYGLNQSDNATDNVVVGGSIMYSGISNINNFAGFMSLTGVTAKTRDENVLTLSSVVSGPFSEGETVTGGTSGASATVRYYWSSSSAAGVTKVFLSGVSGAFSISETITGGISGASATVDGIVTPDTNSNGDGGIQSFQNVILADSPQVGFVNVSGQPSVTINNGNVYSNRLPVVSGANAAGANSYPFISTIGDGQFTVEFGSGTALTGASIRYSIT